MANIRQFWKEEISSVRCPRCDELLTLRYPVDEEATIARPVPGLLFSTKADTIICRKCGFTMFTGKKKPPSIRLRAHCTTTPEPRP